MVAPAYSAIRSKLAKDIGLGQQRSAEGVAPEATTPVEAPPAKASRKRSAA